jgi:hypothetical protein
VTISGTNFADPATVRFGQAESPECRVDTPTTITAVAPEGIGTVDVSVRTGGGDSAVPRSSTVNADSRASSIPTDKDWTVRRPDSDSVALVIEPPGSRPGSSPKPKWDNYRNTTGFWARLFKHKTGQWIVSDVDAGTAWSASDSWATNTAAVGAVLGSVTSALSGGFKTIVSTQQGVSITILFILFGGAAALAPVTYGALARKPGPTPSKVLGTAGGLVLAGAFTVFAVVGDLATVGLLVWQLDGGSTGDWLILAALGAAAFTVSLYSVRTLASCGTYKADPDTAKPSLLNHSQHRSATL